MGFSISASLPHGIPVRRSAPRGQRLVDSDPHGGRWEASPRQVAGQSPPGYFRIEAAEGLRPLARYLAGGVGLVDSRIGETGVDGLLSEVAVNSLTIELGTERPATLRLQAEAVADETDRKGAVVEIAEIATPVEGGARRRGRISGLPKPAI